MNTQMERHQEAAHSAGLRSAGVGREGGVHDHLHHHHDEGEQNEKKSVLKKVKAKAKKIKDTITKHGHHGHHDDHARAYEDIHGRHPHVDLEDEDDDEDEELEEGPELHGAPMYESKEVQSHVPGQVAELKEVRSHVPGQVAESKEVRSHVPGQAAAMVGSIERDTTPSAPPPALRHHSADVHPQGKHDKLSDYRSFIPEQVGVSKHDGVTFGGSQTHPLPPHETNLPLTSGIQHNTKPQSHLSHTQGHELSDYSSSFIPDHVGVSKTHPVGGPQTEPASPTLCYTRVHEDTNFPLRSGLGISALKTGIFDRPTSLDSDPRLGDAQPDNYQTKVKDPTARGGQEIGATPILHSLDKMVIFDDKTDQQNVKTNTRQQESLFRPNAGTDHHSLSSGAHEQCGTGSHEHLSTKPVSYETSSFPVNQEDETLSTDHDIGITGLSVSSATSLIADKAIQAKNVVASKLGYGGEGDHQKTNVPFDEGEVGAGKTSSVAEYGKKVASTVYNKVAGVGGAEHGTVGAIYDKGVSTKEYIAEKVTPREEDRSLSDVISGALHKDTGHEDEDEKKEEPRGKVTISAKVARQLGTEDERSEEDKGSGKSGPRGAVVETLRDTVTSWLGIGGDTGPSYVVYHDLPEEANEGMSGHNQEKQQQGQGTLGEPRIK